MKEKDRGERRGQIERRKMHEERIAKVPIENMVFKDLPPPFISVVGPQGSGKSTLVKSVVKYFTHQVVEDIRGPITLSSLKTKRITLFEARADIHQFIDVSKISDLVVFTIDAQTGLEMDTFEFLTLLMSHGLSKVVCVVTNTDRKGDAKHLKAIKRRVWDEICPGIKFFYLGKLHAGRYVDADLSTLCRALGAMKYRPIEWKCTHPHLVVDKIDEACVYGYVRGGAIRKGTDVHIPGFGDASILDVEILNDPVPLHGETRLSLRSRVVYSPMVFGEEVEERRSTHVQLEEEKEVRLFRRSKTVMEEIREDVEVVPVKEAASVEDEETEEDESSLDLEELKEHASGRFQKCAATEEELVEKFNEKYEEKSRENTNFLLREKRRLEELAKKNEDLRISGMIYPGQYVRIRLDNHLPVDVDFGNVVVLGSFLVSEKGLGIVQGKVKKNKWCKRILKTNEPLIFSVGWRRFQSVPVFSMKDATRNRMIKYSPDSMHCNVSFYGPIVPAGTGFSVYTENADFKILASGTVTDLSENARVVKKLKLVGYPKEIVHNTVFVRDMFTSDLEVTKFLGASLKTVSGLRGQIKSARGREGEYRSTFEGKMLMSDIVTLRCFVPVEVKTVFVPVDNLVKKWRGLRRLHEIREELGIRHPYEESSSDGDDGEIVDDGFYGLPKELEKALPLDKRTMPVVSSRIELPVAPDARKRHESTESMKILRRRKDEEDKRAAAETRRKQVTEKKKTKREKQERVRKTISENYKETNRRLRKKSQPG